MSANSLLRLHDLAQQDGALQLALAGAANVMELQAVVVGGGGCAWAGEAL
jgi:predicted NBD/HSP70 family sugar kinase